MQKKSLLVALFCGALCLTGCLKNEESASVAQVRIAKANELNSIAELNKAKAQAEVIYANAEATIANAEAKLREANAALVLAQAETEKVRAELLKVRVELAQVQVEEEKVKLQMKEAELEQTLAEVEAAVAKAETEKQVWVNRLENLLAQAEVDAIKNAQKILEAEEKLEEYLLTLEKAHADSAQLASAKYFDALDSVQTLQKKLIQTKATKALVEAGALKVRDAIHFMMDQVDDQIAEKEAFVSYLKEYQTASPEEIEERLEEAWKNLNDAYADYLAAADVEKVAYEAVTEAESVESTYVDGWSVNFANVVKGLLDGENIPQAEYGQYGYSENYFVDEETGVKYNAAVITDEDGKVTEIIPLWTASAPGKEQVKEEYLIPEVIAGIKIPREAGSLTSIKTRTYYPAKIEFDNIQKVFATYKEYQEDVVLPAFDEEVEAYTEEKKEEIEGRIEDWKADKQYFDDYVANANRAAMVEEAEQAIADSITSANKTHGAIRKAYEAYRDYMVMNYDVDRKYFEARYNAANALVTADSDSTEWVGTLAEAKAAVEDAFTALEEAELLAHNKAGAYEKAKADYDAAAGSSETDIATAKKSWNPGFSPQMDTVWVDGALYNTSASSEDHAEKVSSKIDATKAGTSQVSTATAKTLMEEKETALRDAQWLAAYWTGYGDKEKADAETAKISTITPQYTSAVSAYNSAVTAEAQAKAAYETAANKVTKAGEAKNKAEKALQAAWKDLYPAEDGADPTTWDEYVAAVRDTLLADVTDVPVKLNYYPRKYSITDIQELDPIPDNADPEEVAEGEDYKNYTIAQKAAWFAHQHTVKTEALASAEGELLNQLASHLNVSPKDIESTEDETADELYEAWQKAEDNSEDIMSDAMTNLRKVYWQCANQDRNGRFNNQFYWVNASYQVDPEYQFISGYEWDAENETYVLVEKYFRSYTVDGEEVPNYRRSLAGRIEIAEAILADEEQFAADCKEEYLEEYGMVDPHVVYANMLDEIAEATNGLAEKKAVEPAYVASVENRNTAYAALVDAKIETIASKAIYDLAKDEFEALKAIQNEGIFVYDPDNDNANEDGFVWITIAEEIEAIEGETALLKDAFSALSGVVAATANSAMDLSINDSDAMTIIGEALKSLDTFTKDGLSIAELKAAKIVLQEVLKQGKVSVQVVIDAFDEEIAELDEKIQVYTKIAETYKSIMNAYLGIADEAIVPDEEEIEGDDEE